MTNNIIEFPKSKIKAFPNNIEESISHIDEVRKEYCDEITEDVIEACFSVLNSYGISVTPDEQAIKNIVFMEEAIRSLLYSLKNVPHTFQDIAQSVITITGDARTEMEKMLEENT